MELVMWFTMDVISYNSPRKTGMTAWTICRSLAKKIYLNLYISPVCSTLSFSWCCGTGEVVTHYSTSEPSLIFAQEISQQPGRTVENTDSTLRSVGLLGRKVTVAQAKRLDMLSLPYDILQDLRAQCKNPEEFMAVLHNKGAARREVSNHCVTALLTSNGYPWLCLWPWFYPRPTAFSLRLFSKPPQSTKFHLSFELAT